MTEPEVPPEAPTLVSGVTVEELARALGVSVPPASGPALERLQGAIATAEDVVGLYTGRRWLEDWPSPFPPGPHGAVLQVAVRMYRSADVTFGVLQTELGTTYTGRWVTPEVAAGLLGWRRSFGLA